MIGGSRAQSESGQVGTWPVLLVALSVLSLGFVLFTRMGSAVDESSSIQLAADAAALAGAQSVGRDAPGQLVSAVRSGRPLSCSLGSGAAADFSRRNGSTVIQYCYYPATDRIHVRVRSNDVTQSGRREEAAATAEVGLRLGPCSPFTRPTPTVSATPTPTPTVSPTEPPEPEEPEDVEADGRCGDLPVTVVWPGSGGAPSVNWNASFLRSQIDPRLTG